MRLGFILGSRKICFGVGRRGSTVTRRALILDLLFNMLLPWLGYEILQKYWGFSDFRALLWVTVVPVVYGLAVLLKERRFSLVAGLSLFSLLLSLLSAMLSKDIRMLQIRESFCTALFGSLFLGSVGVGRPLIFLMMREQTSGEQRERVEALMRNPHGRRFLNQMCCAVGGLMVGEFFLKWWMVNHLPIATVLWLGPLVLKILAGLVVLLCFVGARRMRAQIGSGRVHEAS